MCPSVKGELINRMLSGKTEVNYHGKEKESEEKPAADGSGAAISVIRIKTDFCILISEKGGGLRRQGGFRSSGLVEKIIRVHPTVSEVCVTAFPLLPARPAATAWSPPSHLMRGDRVAIEEIRQSCLKELERNCLPSYFQIVNAIPKTISEKPWTGFSKMNSISTMIM
ncbi:MAG: hypothetical protein R2875_08135 [Desulfobacterales bacterium]